jgi:hypothetical protein
MDSLTDTLFLAVSDKVKTRVTPDNLRARMADLDATGGITNLIRTEIVIELLLAFAQLEAKIDAQPQPTTSTQTETPTV